MHGKTVHNNEPSKSSTPTSSLSSSRHSKSPTPFVKIPSAVSTTVTLNNDNSNIPATHCNDDNLTDNEATLSIAKQLISLFCVKSKEKPETVESLPIFLYQKLDNFSFLVHFASLTVLEIVFCKVRHLNALSECKNLNNVQILNVSNNKIKHLNGIQNMTNLKELHIGENEIVSLDIISNFTQLNVIDFHDNFVVDLQPINHCKKLQVIRGGNNKIQTIRNCLHEMNDLEFLNLSANYLLHFDEIDIISTIPQLKHLQLNDPHFGSNPICDLSNYHIYSLYKLTQIQSFDGIKIDDISKQKAQVSMFKKTMFYQILYNCQKRDERALYRITYQITLKLYRLLFKNIEFAYKYIKSEEIAPFVHEINKHINRHDTICHEMWQDLQSIKHRAEQETENKFEILKHELKTAGNLRLIKCDNTIIDTLIQCKISNIENVNILNVMKIEHRFASYAFNKYLQTIPQKIATSNKQKKNDNDIEMDKIFVIDEFLSADCPEILSLILHWQNVDTQIKIKSHTTIKDKACQQQTILFVKGIVSKTDHGNEEWTVNGYQLEPLYIVQLSYKSNNVSDNKIATSDKWSALIDNIFNDMAADDMPTVFKYLYADLYDKWSYKLHSYLQCNCELERKIKHLIKDKDKSTNIISKHSIEITDCHTKSIEIALQNNKTKQISEYITNINISFNNNLSYEIIEMLANFKNIRDLNLSFNSLESMPNIFENMKCLKSIELQGNDIKLLNELTYLKYCQLLTDLNLCNNPIIDGKGFINLCVNIIPSLKILNKKEINDFHNKSPTQNKQFLELFAKNSYKYSIKSVFDEEKTNEYSDKIIFLNLSSCKLLFIPSIISELIHLERLDLSNNYLLQIKNLENNKNLKELIINNNNLISINGLLCLGENNKLNKLEIAFNNILYLQSISKYCANLKFLSFECNKIRDIKELANLTKLIQVNASYNLIEESFYIYSLSNLSNLAILDLIGNKICKIMNDYRYYTIFCCKNSLKMLDGQSITNKEIEASLNIYDGKLHYDWLINKIGHKYFNKINVLDISSANISILDKITLNERHFPNLKVLILSNNNLSNIDTLLQIQTLIHLNLNHNSIEKVDSLNKLTKLEKLQLAHNKIATISSLNIFGLENLKYLSLENNKIIHIDGLRNLPKLEILNLSSNKIRKLSLNCFKEIVSSLHQLNMENNGLKSLQYLNILINLHTLNISKNRINNLRELSILAHFKHLIRIFVKNNPITLTSKLSQSCFQEIIRHSHSIQLVDKTDLNEVRTAYKLEMLNKEIEKNYSSNSLSSSLLALQNPIGLKIQQFPLSTYIKKRTP